MNGPARLLPPPVCGMGGHSFSYKAPKELADALIARAARSRRRT